jgi:hypothetical protein
MQARGANVDQARSHRFNGKRKMDEEGEMSEFQPLELRKARRKLRKIRKQYMYRSSL